MALERHRFLISSLAVGAAIAGIALGILAASTGQTWPQSLTPLRAVSPAMPAGAADGPLFGDLAASLVLTHDALPTAAKPQGWSYPFACCANFDCKEVPQSSVGERPEGYVIKGTGEVVAYHDKRVKDSPDGEFHWCAHQAGLDAGKTICLFVPPRSF